jgi:tRNA modification GTPase
MNYKIGDGIFAKISGGIGSSINLIRISTPKFIAKSTSKDDISKIFSFFKINPIKLKPNFTFLSKIYVNDEFLDEALITYFKAPHSFTGEDCLEIALHGSTFILEEIYSSLLSLGLRFASKGEFSYRAFLNGKMDLVKAEGMANLIASTTKLQHLASKRQFLGEASNEFLKLRSLILEVLAFLESLIDFTDEDLPADISLKLEAKIDEVKGKISSHLKNTSILSLQEGVRVAIIGRPNAGKSSIFNRLCGYEKAIVSKHAGTTRDVIEERMVLKGVPIIFYDTAGIRTSNDEVEIEGVKRAVKMLEKSDIKLLVKSCNDEENFESLARELNLKLDENTICILNKSDINSIIKSHDTLKISALTGEGFSELFNKIEQLLEQNFLPLVQTGLIASERQKQILQQSLNSLSLFNMKKDVELAGEDLRQAVKSLEEIIGKVDVEDVLGSIFSKFCIGK